jgi:hypothetical protein
VLTVLIAPAYLSSSRTSRSVWERDGVGGGAMFWSWRVAREPPFLFWPPASMADTNHREYGDDFQHSTPGHRYQ